MSFGTRSGAARLGKTAAADPGTVLAPVRRQIREIDAELPLAQVRPLTDVISTARAQPRFIALLLGLFAIEALGLAATGNFSVMSYAVAQRANEFGGRMALGAQTSQVLRLVVNQGMKLVAAAIVLGGAAGWALARALSGSLAGLGEFQWLPHTLTAPLLVLVTLAACLAPARRATRVDPVIALRSE